MRLLRLVLLALGVLFAAAISAPAGARDCDCQPLTLERLQRMSTCELMALYRASEVGTPLNGTARGGLVNLTDRVLPRLKVRLANIPWRGKKARSCDGYFINRWVGNVEWIDSYYVVGPSWIDGKPAVIMEYEPGTPLFWNMHDELREVAPGLYFGPVYHRHPQPYLRGFVALQMECGCK
jgi:hypothetical protein